MWTKSVGIEGLMVGIEEGSWPGTELIITFVIEDKLIPIVSVGIFHDGHRWKKLLHWNCVRLVCIDTKVANCNLLAVRRHENPCIELHEGEKCEKDRTKQAEKAA